MSPSKLVLSVAFCLILASNVSEAFFLGSYRKQAPHAAPWAPPPTAATGSATASTNTNNNNNLNNGLNPGQPSHGSYKDYGSYPQQTLQIPTTQQVQPQRSQSPQQSEQQQQQQQPQHQPQTLQQQHHSQVQSQQLHQQTYPSHHQITQGPALPKYDPATFQIYNQQQFAYEGGPGSYPQNVHLIPCLCPVNKEIIEQQQIQQKQPISSGSYTGDSSGTQVNPQNIS